ncbi:MAG: polysaccharide biosynthesis/export family protein [Verrucomicrobiota bacterium]
MRFHPLMILLGIVFAMSGMAQETGSTKSTTNLVRVTTSYVLDDKHQLEPGDKISFQIIEDQDPPVSRTVTDSSELDAPYVGRVSVANKTCRQVAETLKAMLEKDYYYRATVIIGLDSVNRVRGHIYIWGQVRNQGPIDLLFKENLTAGQAILRAGGFGDFADKKKVKVVRNPGGEEVTKQIFLINMVDVLENGDIEKDIPLQPGDFLIVPSRLINF